MTNKTNPFIWEENFPHAFGHTSISYLKKCTGYKEAKSGDITSAYSVVKTCAKQSKILALKYRYPNAILLPVISNNSLPKALANEIGLEVYPGVEQKKLQRKNMSSMERLLHKPIFAGDIIKGQSYIIIDDILTQGGTVAALRRYVISQGGFISAVMTLSYSAGSQFLAPSSRDISRLMYKFGCSSINTTLRAYHIASDVRELTRSQIKYLLRFNKISHIRRKMDESLISLKEHPVH